jgi:hypothetical protein
MAIEVKNSSQSGAPLALPEHVFRSLGSYHNQTAQYPYLPTLCVAFIAVRRVRAAIGFFLILQATSI